MNCLVTHRWLSLSFTPLLASAALIFFLHNANPTRLAQAQEAQLRPGQLISAGGTSLAPGSYAIPCAADWNGDGRKDLLVGYQTAGRVSLYLNSGTDASPVFTNYINLQAGGADIVHASSGCGAPAPFVCDYDSDGSQDLLVGEGNYGYVYFYRNTNSDAAPILAPGMQLMQGSSPLSVSSRATPYLYDWNGDGLNDLLCGNGNGYVFFFKNIGSQQAPAYAASTLIQAGGTNLNLGIRSVIRMFDWDGDGVKDFVGSSDTGVYWCRNTGSDGAPLLQARVALRAPVSGSGLIPISTGPRMRLHLVDWDNDGAIDLLIGNAAGTVSLFNGYRFAITAITRQPLLEWNSSPYLYYNILAGPSPGSTTNFLATRLPSAGNITSWASSAITNQQFYRIQIVP